MTTLELFRKHRKGEVSRERFLYEVRRDSNLPWVTNTTSYDDAVKILKNKGIIREAEISELSPQTRYNATMASVDRLKNLPPDSLAYKKGISQASKFIHNIDPVIKKTVEDFAKKIGLNVSIKKEAEGSEYIPYVLIKFYEKDSQNPEITVTLTKDSEKISGKLPNQEDERRLLNIIKQIQKKELDVKDTKSASQLKEAQFEPQNIPTDPLVDRVNPYALKREVEKLLAKEPELTNDSYKQALNKAAKKLTTPEGVKKAMFANAESVAKADANLQTQPVKKGNHVDKKNGMKKMKGQQMPKATAAPTKENKKTKKPKGVEIMPDKGVEGSEKVIKESLISELTAYLKKKLNLAENSPYHNFYEGMVIPMEEGVEGIVKEINGGTLCIVLPDGSEMDMQMNRAQQLIDKSKELPQSVQDMGAKQEYESGFEQLEEETPKTEMYTDEPGGDEPLFKDKKGNIITKGSRVLTIDNEKGEIIWKSPTSDFIVVKVDAGYEISTHAKDVEKIEDDEDEDEMDENLFVKGTGPQATTLVATQPSSKNALKSAGYKEIPNTQDVR